MKKVLKGPDGIKIILDSTEIFPHDPGAGTPALVEYRKSTASYNCATATGEVGCGEYQLSRIHIDWLNSEKVESAVDDFLRENSPKKSH